MRPKNSITINLDIKVIENAETYAEIAGVSRAEYLAAIIEWWYGQNSPPISNADARKRTEKTARQNSPTLQLTRR